MYKKLYNDFQDFIMRKTVSDNFLFLSPRLTIRNAHLKDRDVKKIKVSLSKKMGATSLLVAIGLFVISIVLLVSMGISTGWKQSEVYGLTSLIGQIISVVGSSIVVILEILGLILKDNNKKIRFANFGNNLLPIIIAMFIFLSFYADAQMGYLTTPTISASIIALALLVLLQPVFWSIAIIYDFIVTATIIGLTILCQQLFHIQGAHYYILIAILYPLVSYLFISILFYAETQQYVQKLRNEALFNTAQYDELTRCKNRHALKLFFEENHHRWEEKGTSVLFVMFDIDDFKMYNDQYSHLGGDHCLYSIAESIRKAFPSPSLDFYRYGGEEFMLFFEIYENTNCREILETIRITIKELKIKAADGAKHKVVTASIGGKIVNFGRGINIEKELHDVDAYLYKAKDAGKDTCILNGKEIVK